MDESTTKTWMRRGDGPVCTGCNDPLTRGHRYYENGDGSVIHYCCAKQKLQEN